MGKYARLNFDKVIAVSRSGFTPSALKKAESEGIECRTLEAALDTNWPSDFIKIGLSVATPVIQEADVGLVIDPPYRGPLEDDATFITRMGEPRSIEQFRIGILEDAVKLVARTLAGPTSAVVAAAFTEYGGTCLLELHAPPEGMRLVRGGTEHRVTDVIFRVTLTTQEEPLIVSHERYPDVLVSTVEPPEPGRPRVTVIQGKGGDARVLTGPELDVVAQVPLAMLRKPTEQK